MYRNLKLNWSLIREFKYRFMVPDEDKHHIQNPIIE